MSRTTVTRTIDAPVETVFATIASIENLSKAVPHITKVEFLSDVKSGVGARFRETRIYRGREATNELEVTEHVENERVRIISETHGTTWDSVFTVKPEAGKTTLELTMDARARKLLPRLMNPLMMGMLRKALESDMDAVKAYCEGGERP